MAFEEITNEVREEDGETRIFCANCGDPENGTGYADPASVMQYWKKATDDTLVCGDPRCLGAVLSLEDERIEELLAEGVQESSLTEEQVAAMPAPVDTTAELDLSVLSTHEEG